MYFFWCVLSSLIRIPFPLPFLTTQSPQSSFLFLIFNIVAGTIYSYPAFFSIHTHMRTNAMLTCNEGNIKQSEEGAHSAVPPVGTDLALLLLPSPSSSSRGGGPTLVTSSSATSDRSAAPPTSVLGLLCTTNNNSSSSCGTATATRVGPPLHHRGGETEASLELTLRPWHPEAAPQRSEVGMVRSSSSLTAATTYHHHAQLSSHTAAAASESEEATGLTSASSLGVTSHASGSQNVRRLFNATVQQPQRSQSPGKGSTSSLHIVPSTNNAQLHPLPHVIVPTSVDMVTASSAAAAVGGSTAVILLASILSHPRSPTSPVVNPDDLAACNSLTSSPATFFTRAHSAPSLQSPTAGGSAPQPAPLAGTRLQAPSSALPLHFASPTISPTSILSRSSSLTSSTQQPQGVGGAVSGGGSSSRRGSGMQIHFAREEVLTASTDSTTSFTHVQQQQQQHQTPQGSHHPLRLSLPSHHASLSPPQPQEEEQLFASSNNNNSNCLSRSGRPGPPPRLFSPRQWELFQSQNRGQRVTQVIHHHCHPPPAAAALPMYYSGGSDNARSPQCPSSPLSSPTTDMRQHHHPHRQSPPERERDGEGFVRGGMASAPTAVVVPYPQQQQHHPSSSYHGPTALRRSDSDPLNRELQHQQQSSSPLARRAESPTTAQYFPLAAPTTTTEGIAESDEGAPFIALGSCGSAGSITSTILIQWPPPPPPPPPVVEPASPSPTSSSSSSSKPLPLRQSSASGRGSSPVSSSTIPVAPAPSLVSGLDSFMTASWKLPSALFDSISPAASLAGSALSVHNNNNNNSSSRHNPSSRSGGGGGGNSYRSRHAQQQPSLVSSQELLTVPTPPPPPQAAGSGSSLSGASARSSPNVPLPPIPPPPPSVSHIASVTGAAAVPSNVARTTIATRSSSSSSIKLPQQPTTNVASTAALPEGGVPSQSVFLSARGGDSSGGFGPLYESRRSLLSNEGSLAQSTVTTVTPPPPAMSEAPKDLTFAVPSPLPYHNPSNSSYPMHHQSPDPPASGNWVPLQISTSFGSAGDPTPPPLPPPPPHAPRQSRQQLDESLSFLQSFCRQPASPPLMVVPSAQSSTPKHHHGPSTAASRSPQPSPNSAVRRRTVFVSPPHPKRHHLAVDPPPPTPALDDTETTAVWSLPHTLIPENQRRARPSLLDSRKSSASTELRVNSSCSTRTYAALETDEEVHTIRSTYLGVPAHHHHHHHHLLVDLNDSSNRSNLDNSHHHHHHLHPDRSINNLHNTSASLNDATTATSHSAEEDGCRRNEGGNRLARSYLTASHSANQNIQRNSLSNNTAVRDGLDAWQESTTTSTAVSTSSSSSSSAQKTSSEKQSTTTTCSTGTTATSGGACSPAASFTSAGGARGGRGGSSAVSFSGLNELEGERWLATPHHRRALPSSPNKPSSSSSDTNAPRPSGSW